MSYFAKVFLTVCLVWAASAAAEETAEARSLDTRKDLDSSATSAKLFNLGSLFGQTPGYGYGSGIGSYYPTTNYRPGYYPTTTTAGYYPSISGSYYPSTAAGYYPSTTGTYYPSTTGGFYPSTSWTGTQYPSTGYYPTTTGTGTGTNILGGNGYYPGTSGGYGGYRGNGGLHQYSGYWNPDYSGQRNRGFGYFAGTDRYGLPQGGRGGEGGLGGRDPDRYGNDRVGSRQGDLYGDRNGGRYGDRAGNRFGDLYGDRDRDRDHVPGGYRGYD